LAGLILLGGTFAILIALAAAPGPTSVPPPIGLAAAAEVYIAPPPLERWTPDPYVRYETMMLELKEGQPEPVRMPEGSATWQGEATRAAEHFLWEEIGYQDNEYWTGPSAQPGTSDDEWRVKGCLAIRDKFGKLDGFVYYLCTVRENGDGTWSKVSLETE
jgi:hypothetical protein